MKRGPSWPRWVFLFLAVESPPPPMPPFPWRGQIGFPVAAKLASHQIVHKTEIGGVLLNLMNEQSGS